MPYKDLRQFLKELELEGQLLRVDNIAAYKRLRIVEFREEIPKIGAGKILRTALIEAEKKGE